MSDANHTNQTKLQFWLDNDTLRQLDELLDKYGYTSRSEWFRDMVRQELFPVEPDARATGKVSQK
jgi:metal-responsive CopG/Arc/MetJ family transcriptional regulator